MLTKSELAVSSVLLPWTLEESHSLGKSKVSNMTVAVVTWVQVVDMQVDQVSPGPIKL